MLETKGLPLRTRVPFYGGNGEALALLPLNPDLKIKIKLSGETSLPSASLIAAKVNDWPINASVPPGRKCSIRPALRRHSSRKRRSAFSKFFRPLTKSERFGWFCSFA